MTSGDNLTLLYQAAADAAQIVLRARSATLATLDQASGHPYASLVTVALDVTGAPLLLVSKLARHTQNLMADSRASLLVPLPTADGDPLALGRVTLMGRLAPTTSPTAKARFLSSHPGATVYADFADFGFYSLAVSNAHFIGGFGRIIDIAGADLLAKLVAEST
jgi:heme iron utilization protein